MKKLAVLLIVVAMLGFGAVQAYSWYQYQVYTPVSARSQPVSVHVSVGESRAQLTDDLYAKGLIRDKSAFDLYLRLSGAEAGIQAGDYLLNKDMSMADIVAGLQHSTVAQVAVAIPEGYTIQKIAQVAQADGLGTAAAYVAATRSPSWNADFLASKPKTRDLEGYLFPDTYSLNRGAGVNDLISVQLKTFAQAFTAQMRSDITKPMNGRPVESIDNIVILASMVEREVNRPQDRPVVCGLYYNRLSINMALQVDATVLYAEGVWKKVVTFDDLKFQSPYNTYLQPGLPPGPISNPGAAALRACVYPQASDYLYYFTDKSGNTHFEKTLDQFNQDKATYGVAGS